MEDIIGKNLKIFNPLLLFLSCLTLSFILSISRNSIFLLWFSLELNILRFLPIISSVFLIINFNSFMGLIVNVAIVIKLGGAPFHGWFFSLSKSIRLNTIFILSTLQKLIPIIILSNLNFYFYFLISILRFLVILFNGINLISLIKVLALS